MSRRKQARPIRVLESEEVSSAGNLPIMDIVNGEGSSEAESGASGGSLAESEDEDAANDTTSDIHESQDPPVNISPPLEDAEFERLRSADQFDAYPNSMVRSSAANERLRDHLSGRNEYDESEPSSVQEIAVLQSTLYHLHHQQMMQINLIQQLQQQLQFTKSSTRSSSPVQPNDLTVETTSSNNNDHNSISQLRQQQQQHMMQANLFQQLRYQVQYNAGCSTRSSSPVQQCDPENVSPNDDNNNNSNNVPVGLSLVVGRTSSPISQILTPPKPSRTPTPVRQERNSTSPAASQPLSATGCYPTPKISSSPPIVSSQPLAVLPSCSVSSSFASSIITNLDPPPSPSEPNSLEMLKKRTQEVLENASQGLLANNLADELAFRKNGANGKGSSLSPYDSKSGGRNEPFFKHRCRYCGKVFGSDSALQIHIRSHTGERPFKCNVCGSRFTTKGNLKVHFQRHTQKFPHIKMNPNPIPEHLDKYHPPLLAQVNNHQTLPPGILGPHPIIPSLDRSNSPYGECGMDLKMYLSRRFPPMNVNMNPNSLDGERDNNASSAAAMGLSDESMQEYNETSIPLLDRSNSPYGECGIDLKMHFQRHPQKFPHSSMNSNPANRERDTNSAIEMPMSEESTEESTEDQQSPRGERDTKIEPSEDSLQEQPENLSSQVHSRRSPNTYQTPSDGERDTSNAMEMPMSDESMEGSNEDQQSQHDEHDSSNATMVVHSEDSQQEQPENLSNKSRSEVNDLSLDSRKCYSRSSFPSPRFVSPASSVSSDSFDRYSSCTPLASYSNDSDPSKDPFLYTNFLPRPGSTDNSWENLIEINKTSETSKLQELVDNIGHKLTDPNECVVCHRVLSCKSALQMHYRTHTGERPFRCKICGRSFTTKGNLKTHMGVHRIKPPVRVHHQCPVCHKRFTNNLILQQHIRLHTGEPTDLTPEQIQASEIKDYFPHFMPAFNASKTLPLSHVPGGVSVAPQHVKVSENGCDTTNERSEKGETAVTGLASSSGYGGGDGGDSPLVYTTSLAALENHVKTVTTMSSHMAMATMTQSFVNLCSKFSNGTTVNSDLNDVTSPGFRRTADSPECSEALSPRSRRSASPTLSTAEEEDTSPAADDAAVVDGATSTPLDLTPKSSGSPSTSAGALTSGSVYAANNGTASFCFTSSSTSTNSTPPLISSVLTTSFNPLGLAVASSVRGNTTCNICYKTFACNSALEIHYRSHTKERPYKCTVCDRGFSTKGNMKQHLLTHKIRDVSTRMLSTGSVSVPSSLVDETSNTSTESKDTIPSSAASMRCLPLDSLPSSLSPSLRKAVTAPSLSSLPAPPPIVETVVMPPQKRSPDSEAMLPVPKRQSSLPKHLCHVCNKNFSSSSALQIHMRTHTGDKPFRCNVCMKAFTTKGNLKVHMGTHMWTNGASRRGRRMSLELPSMPLGNKDSQPELFARRPEFSYYPYLPTPFLNGLHKGVGTSLTNGFFPFGAYANLGDLKRPVSPMSPPLPLIGRHVTSDSHSSPAPWDLHFERKAGDEHVDANSPSPPHPPHGEGLAAS